MVAGIFLELYIQILLSIFFTHTKSWLYKNKVYKSFLCNHHRDKTFGRSAQINIIFCHLSDYCRAILETRFTPIPKSFLHPLTSAVIFLKLFAKTTILIFTINTRLKKECKINFAFNFPAFNHVNHQVLWNPKGAAKLSFESYHTDNRHNIQKNFKKYNHFNHNKEW